LAGALNGRISLLPPYANAESRIEGKIVIEAGAQVQRSVAIQDLIDRGLEVRPRSA
jgi:hypothetical protein